MTGLETCRTRATDYTQIEEVLTVVLFCLDGILWYDQPTIGVASCKLLCGQLPGSSGGVVQEC
uniref:Uncharacterized protein n=1 Tax=Arundo donax TaxID=35708 RepID=A0A0A8Y9H1_ARUDO